ncbi:hypothetical protein OK074_8565 [Actinobacteria bacterium OK074]|nr:hypothetical protein OK074_8565 [Actinobacteria bacterium OK074]
MSFTLPSRLRRRTLLASAAGAVALAGCSNSPESAAARARASAATRARARAARDSEALAAEYAAVITGHPTLAERLRPLRAEVVRHARAFGGGTTSGETSEASASPTAAPSPSVTVDPATALADLAASERALADKRAKALVELPGELARLLASVAAAGAAHAYLLTEGDK